jgi:phage terminase large subunit-like protein
VPGRDWDRLIAPEYLSGYDPHRLSEGYTFNARLADRVCDFIEKACRHTKGAIAGQPMKLEDWQAAFVGNIYGWVDCQGLRRYREAMLYIPRKNGKTTILAGLTLYALFCDGEPGAEVYSAAGDREQASLVYDQMEQMIGMEPQLDSRAKIYTATKTIMYPKGGSKYKAISAEARTKHGFNTHFAIVDELHTQRDRSLVDVLQTSMGSRDQPMLVYLTTADEDRPSVCNEIHDYACQVRDGKVDDAQFMPVIYEASVDDDPGDPETWRKANPNLGISVSEPYIKQQWEKAQRQPSFFPTFLQLHLNVRSRAADEWIRLDSWDKCQEEDFPDMDGCQTWVGLDLAATTDFCCAALVYWAEGRFWLKTKHWIPEATSRRREENDKIPCAKWHAEGWLDYMPGEVADFDIIREWILRLDDQVDLRSVAIDRWNAHHLITQLDKNGIEVVPHGQGFASMASPTRGWEELILTRGIAQDGNPCMRWMVSNARVKLDEQGNVKPDKKRSSERIDGVVAAIMAVGMGLIDDPEDSSNPYAEGGAGMLVL